MSFSPETEKLVNELIQAEYKNACEQAKKSLMITISIDTTHFMKVMQFLKKKWKK